MVHHLGVPRGREPNCASRFALPTAAPHPSHMAFSEIYWAFPVTGRSHLLGVPMAWRRRRQAKAKWRLGRRKWRGTQTWGVSATWPWPGTVSTALQYSTTAQCSTLHYTTLHHTTLHYTTLHCSAVQYSAVQYSTVHFRTLPPCV